MPPTPPTPRSLVSVGEARPEASAPQKRFHSLLKQIRQVRETLAAWEAQRSAFEEAHARQIMPLVSEGLALQRDWVRALDRALDRPGWSRTDRTTLVELICEGADEVLSVEPDNAEFAALRARHQADAPAGPDRPEPPPGGEDPLAALWQELQQRLHHEEPEPQQPGPPAESTRRAAAAQKRRETAARHAAMSVRDVFRKLASALHPDREPDPVAREAKNALMQQANQAYAADDLLGLLELHGQLDPAATESLAAGDAARLRAYNQALSRQLEALRQALRNIQQEFWLRAGMPAQPLTRPEQALHGLKHLAVQMRRDLDMRRIWLRLMDDRTWMRRWLKTQRQAARQRAVDLDGDWF